MGHSIIHKTNLSLYLELLAALLPLVELDAGGEVLLVGAAEGPVDNGCSCRELTMFHRDGSPRRHRSRVCNSYLEI